MCYHATTKTIQLCICLAWKQSEIESLNACPWQVEALPRSVGGAAIKLLEWFVFSSQKLSHPSLVVTSLPRSSVVINDPQFSQWISHNPATDGVASPPRRQLIKKNAFQRVLQPQLIWDVRRKRNAKNPLVDTTINFAKFIWHHPKSGTTDTISARSRVWVVKLNSSTINHRNLQTMLDKVGEKNKWTSVCDPTQKSN